MARSTDKGVLYLGAFCQVSGKPDVVYASRIKPNIYPVPRAVVQASGATEDNPP